MKKRIQKYGNTKIIRFTKEDCELYDIRVGQIYDIEMNLATEKTK